MRLMSDYIYWIAFNIAMISSEDNDTSVQPQSQAMGTVLWEPQEGESPMELISY